ncbi:hypothetical protein G9C98_005932, partial [Cotesia typhae]
MKVQTIVLRNVISGSGSTDCCCGNREPLYSIDKYTSLTVPGENSRGRSGGRKAMVKQCGRAMVESEAILRDVVIWKWFIQTDELNTTRSPARVLVLMLMLMLMLWYQLEFNECHDVDVPNWFLKYTRQMRQMIVQLLMINLTSPALMVYNEELPAERTNRNYYLQLVSYLQGYKKALTDERVWTVVSGRLGKILKIDTSERGEENELIIERILTLIRNVLQVPPHDNDKRADNDATVHDEVLFALHASGIVDLLLFIASNSSEQQFHVQIIEIIALMLREQNASKLAVVGLERTAEEKAREEAKLLAVRQKEITEKMEKMKKYSGSRHSRFGGTFVVQNMKGIGENQLICHRPFDKIEAFEFSRDKTKMKKPKNRVFVEPAVEERMSALSVRLFLKEFCVEFLIGAYNPVMRYAKSFIIGDSADKSDGIHYFWALRFFMEFNRHYKFQVKYVSLDKDVRDSSKVIKSNIFYVPEYRETILGQLLSYNGLKMSRNYLVDLVITTHLFVKMLEQFCDKSRNVMVAKAKAKKRKGTKKKTKQKKEQEQTAAVQKSLDERWDDAGPELSAVMQEGTIPDVVPFDAILDTPIEDQKSDAMKKIQKLLRKKEFEEAVGLLRASRQVWPENDCFGKPDIPVEEEFLALREIFFADLGGE